MQERSQNIVSLQHLSIGHGHDEDSQYKEATATA